MNIYKNQDCVGADLLVGDLLRSKRGIHSLLIHICEGSLTLLTESGHCYTISREQINTYARCAHVNILALRFDNVFSEDYIASLAEEYHSLMVRNQLIDQLADIPAEVLEAALEARRTQNLIHSRPTKA